MNTTLLIQQLTVAILASAIVIPTVQKVKGWLPNAKLVEPVSAVLAFAIGLGVAYYYNGYNLIDSGIVGFFSVIGAEGIYKLLSDKLSTYTDIKQLPKGLDLNAEIQHLIDEEV